MHIEAFHDYCLSKKGVTEDFPFDQQTLYEQKTLETVLMDGSLPNSLIKEWIDHSY